MFKTALLLFHKTTFSLYKYFIIIFLKNQVILPYSHLRGDNQTLPRYPVNFFQAELLIYNSLAKYAESFFLV